MICWGVTSFEKNVVGEGSKRRGLEQDSPLKIAILVTY